VIEANRPVHVVDVQLTPPVGRERLFAVWSRTPAPLHLEELRSLAEDEGESGSRPYHGTRDMLRVKDAVRRLPRADWHAVVLEVEHG
jgi:hypothetical protein